MPDPVEEFLGSLEKPKDNAPVDDFLGSIGLGGAPSLDDPSVLEANKQRQLALDANLPPETLPEPVADITLPAQEPMATATDEDKMRAGVIDVNSGAMSPISMANPPQFQEKDAILRRVGAVGWGKSVMYPKEASDSFRKNILASTYTDKDGKPAVSSNLNDYTTRSELMDRLANASSQEEKDSIRKQLVARGLPSETIDWLQNPQGWYQKKVDEVWSDKFPTAKTSADASKMQDQLDIAEAKYIFAKRNTGPKFAARGANANGTAQMVPAADVAFPNGEKARAYLAKASEEDKKALDEVRTERLWMGALQSVIGGLTGNLTKGYAVSEKTQEQIDKAVEEAPGIVKFGIETAGMAAAGLPMGAASKAFTVASKAGLVKAGLSAAAAEAKAAKLGHTLSMALYGGVSTPGEIDEKLKGALHLAAFGYTAGRLSQPMESWFAKLPSAEKSKFVDYVGKAMSSGLAFAGADQIVNDIDPATALQAGLQGVVFGLAGGAATARKPKDLVEAPKVEAPKTPEVSMVAFEAAEKAALNSGRTPQEAKAEAVKAAVEASKAMPAPEAVAAPVERRKAPERPGSPRTLTVDKITPGQDITVRATNGEIVEGKLSGKREDGAIAVDTAEGTRTFTPAEVERIHPYIPREGAAKIPDKVEPASTPVDPKDTDAVIAARIERLDMAADAGKSAISGLDDFEAKLSTAKKLVENGVDRNLAVEALTSTNVDASHPAHLSAVEAGALYDRAIKESPAKPKSPELPNPLEGTRVGPRVVAEGGVEGNVVPGTVRTENGKKIVDVVTDKGERISVSRESLARAPEPVVEAPKPEVVPEAKDFYDRTVKIHQDARAQVEDSLGRRLTPAEMDRLEIMTPERIRDIANERFGPRARKSKTGERGIALVPDIGPALAWIKERGKDAFRLGRATLEWFPGRGLENMRRASEAYEKSKGTLNKSQVPGSQDWYHMPAGGVGEMRVPTAYEEAVKASTAKHKAEAEKELLQLKGEAFSENDLRSALDKVEDAMGEHLPKLPQWYKDHLAEAGIVINDQPLPLFDTKKMDINTKNFLENIGRRLSKGGTDKIRSILSRRSHVSIDPTKAGGDVFEIVSKLMDTAADFSIFRVVSAMEREGSAVALRADPKKSDAENQKTPDSVKGWDRMRITMDEGRKIPTLYLDRGPGGNIPGETFWVKPSVASELQHLADLHVVERAKGLGGALSTASTWVQTKGILDSVFHGMNITAEGFKAAPIRVLHALTIRARELANNAEARNKLQKRLADVGASREPHKHEARERDLLPGEVLKPGEKPPITVASKVEKVLGQLPIPSALTEKAGIKLNIEGLGNWALNHADLAVRELLLDKAEARIQKYNSKHKDNPLTPTQELEIKRREVLQAGNYNQRTMDQLTKIIRTHQVQPFAVAAKTMTSNAWKVSPAGVMAAGIKALASKAKTGKFDPVDVIEFKRRLGTMARMVAIATATAAAWNLHKTGKMFPDGIPFGSFYSGEKDGRPQYANWPARLMGGWQMGSYTGTRAAMEKVTGKGYPHGSWPDTIEDMAAAVLGRVSHVVTGPAVEMTLVGTGASSKDGATFFNPSMRTLADAATETNSLIHSVVKASEETGDIDSLGDVLGLTLRSVGHVFDPFTKSYRGLSADDIEARKKQMYKVFDQANRIIKKAKDADPEKRQAIIENSLKAYADSLGDDPDRDRKMGLINREVRSRVARWEASGDQPASDGTVPLSQDPGDIVDGLVTAYGQVKPKDEAAWIKARLKDIPPESQKEVRIELLRRLQLPTDTLGKPQVDEVVERIVRDFFDLDANLPLRERNQWLSEELQGYSMNPAFSQEELATIRKNTISRIQARRRGR